LNLPQISAATIDDSPKCSDAELSDENVADDDDDPMMSSARKSARNKYTKSAIQGGLMSGILGGQTKFAGGSFHGTSGASR